MKIKTKFWEFFVTGTFIKATPTIENRYAKDIRIYSSPYNFLKDFDCDEVTEKIIEYFDKNKTTDKRSFRHDLRSNNVPMGQQVKS